MASRDAAVEYEQMAGWLRHFRHLSLRLLRLPSYEFRVYGPDYLARSLPRLEASYKGSRIRIRGRPRLFRVRAMSSVALILYSINSSLFWLRYSKLKF